ncbi:MAG TPA: hypothetical protein VG846_16035, partial [Actinomycetota bacterium]|nr:hypothetical protein [Actinomycetota bacterium]
MPATIVGTNGSDVLRGTPGRDVIAGPDGNDVILGLGGDDVICGGQQGTDLSVPRPVNWRSRPRATSR